MPSFPFRRRALSAERGAPQAFQRSPAFALAPLLALTRAMSGYLDDRDAGSSSSLLFAHLQQQSYHRRIPSTGRRWKEERNDDDVLDDGEDQLSITTWDSQEEERQAQEEWEESMRQLNLAVQVMVLPFFGKWLGRKWSYWGERARASGESSGGVPSDRTSLSPRSLLSLPGARLYCVLLWPLVAVGTHDGGPLLGRRSSSTLRRRSRRTCNTT